MEQFTAAPAAATEGLPPLDGESYNDLCPTPENTALFNAALAGSAMGVASALKKGAKVGYFHRPEEQKTSLHVAAELGHAEVCTLLLEAGCTVDQIALTNKDTPLVLAASGGHASVVTLLLDANANIHKQNCYGNSALHEAAHHGYLDTCKLLLSRGAQASQQNNKGSTALHLACYGESKEEHPLELVKLLAKEVGSDVNAVDSRGVSPLIAACSVGRDDIISHLLDSGANGKHVDNSGMDGLSTATFQRHEKKLSAQLQKQVTCEAPASVFT